MFYLDNAATSFPKPPCVAEAVVHFMNEVGSSESRSAYASSVDASRILYKCRKELSSLIGQVDASRTIFTHNATHAINTALYGLLKQGDVVVVSALEHNALMRPLYELSKTRGVEVRVVSATPWCGLDLDEAKRAMKGAKLVACVHANNVTGALMPISRLSEYAHQMGALMMVDASQSVGAMPCLMSDLGADILCGSGHKGLLGPMGTGFLSLGESVEVDFLSTLMQGGTGSLSEEEIQPSFLPDKFESGTPNMHGIAGLLASLLWIKQRGVEHIHAHELALRQRLYDGLCEIPNVQVCKVDAIATSTLSFWMKHKRVSQIGLELDRDFGICARIGLHCSPQTHKSIGTFEEGGTVRLSAGVFSTEDEIDNALYAISKIAK